MKHLKTILIALGITLFSIVLSFLLFRPYGLTAQVLRTLMPPQGGTGNSATPSAGQLLIGLTNGSYSVGYLTAGANITIATGSGSITITGSAGSGSGSFNATGSNGQVLIFTGINTGTSSNLLTFATSTGILTVDGTASTSGLIFATGTGTNLFLSGDERIGTTTALANSLLLIGTSSPILTVLNNNRIGISNSAPISRLHIGSGGGTYNSITSVGLTIDGNVVNDDNLSPVALFQGADTLVGISLVNTGTNGGHWQFLTHAQGTGFGQGAFSIYDAEVGGDIGQRLILDANGSAFIAGDDAMLNGTIAILGNITGGKRVNINVATSTNVGKLTVGTLTESATNSLLYLARSSTSLFSIQGGSASGTLLATNPITFNGDFINFQVNSSSRFKLDNLGNASFTHATLTSLTVSSVTSAIPLAGADGSFTEYAGSACGGSDQVVSISAVGAVTCSSQGAGGTFNATGSNGQLFVFTSINTGTSSQRLTFATSTGLLTVDGTASSSGLIFGIGTGSSLTLSGNATTAQLTITGIASGNCLQSGLGGVVTSAGSACGSGGVSGWYITDTGFVSLSTTTNRVGIGATSSGVVLNIANTMTQSATASMFLLNTSGTVLTLQGGSASGTLIAANPSLFNGDFIHFQIASTTAFRASGVNSTSTVFEVASSSGASIFKVTVAGIVASGSAPTLSACGTSPSVVLGNNNAGEFTAGSVLATTCSMTFNPSFQNLAAGVSCSVVDETDTIAGTPLLISMAATTTNATITSATAFTSDKIKYQCIGY